MDGSSVAGRARFVTTTVAMALLLFAVLATSAPASPFAPLNRPGPKLRVDKQKLRDSLVCTEDVAGADRAPVLLVPATGVNSDQNFSWNYENLFTQQGIPFCTSDQPGVRNSNQTDIQLRGQYLTYAIRAVHRKADRKIAIVGHSQGGMAMRWPLRFWPDTRGMVDDVIGFAGTNHGTTQAADCDGTATAPPPARSSRATPSSSARSTRGPRRSPASPTPRSAPRSTRPCSPSPAPPRSRDRARSRTC